MTPQLSFAATLDRDGLGRIAHQAFRAWAVRHVKPDCLAAYDIPWESLPERQREAYRAAAWLAFVALMLLFLPMVLRMEGVLP